MADFSASPDVHALDTERILATLAAHGVEYVLVGGVACLMHGSTRVTVDADLVPAAFPENLARLVEALRSLGAAVFVPQARMRMEAGEPWEVVALRRGPEALLEADAWHFTTDADRSTSCSTLPGSEGTRTTWDEWRPAKCLGSRSSSQAWTT